MKKIIIFISLLLATGILASAQSSPLIPDKVKQIKLLESTRDDVQKILAGYDLDDSYDPGFYQKFSSKNETVKIWYSQGKCSNEPDDESISGDWNVSEWKVIQIGILPEDTVTLKNINFKSFEFIKEREYREFPNYYIFHNKNLGIAYETVDDEIRTAYLRPGKKDYSLLCNNQTLKKFYSGKSWFNDGLTWKERYLESPNYLANVTRLFLSSRKIIIKCSAAGPVTNSREIDVSVTAEDPENDVLTYSYYITVGKIIGRGAKVVWDLSGVKPGTYKITAGVDDGCGVCGKTKTKTVTVKESPDCYAK